MAFRDEVLRFVSQQQIESEGTGRYRYSTVCSRPTLYSSCYAVMIRSLFGDLGSLSVGPTLLSGKDERTAWTAYLQSFQQDDGLFCDPVIYNQGSYTGDPFDCGRPHLTCHVLTALACLGATAQKPFAWVETFSDLDTLRSWLDCRDWGERVAWTGNEIMNLGTLLQYSRDFHADVRAGRAMECMLDWLESNYLDPAIGLWGAVDTADPLWRSHAVQAAYHWWTLFAYDKRPFPCAQRAIDTLLATQNPLGGFGWGVHNPCDPWTSSACEDIDSIDPLARLSSQTDYRIDDIRAALARAADRVLVNHSDDGGFVFVRDSGFEYGHPELRGERGQGAMFPTWFRTLSLAYIGKALPEHTLGQYPWMFADCPGYQFWRPTE